MWGREAVGLVVREIVGVLVGGRGVKRGMATVLAVEEARVGLVSTKGASVGCWFERGEACFDVGVWARGDLLGVGDGSVVRFQGEGSVVLRSGTEVWFAAESYFCSDSVRAPLPWMARLWDGR